MNHTSLMTTHHVGYVTFRKLGVYYRFYLHARPKAIEGKNFSNVFVHYPPHSLLPLTCRPPNRRPAVVPQGQTPLRWRYAHRVMTRICTTISDIAIWRGVSIRAQATMLDPEPVFSVSRCRNIAVNRLFMSRQEYEEDGCAASRLLWSGEGKGKLPSQPPGRFRGFTTRRRRRDAQNRDISEKKALLFKML